MLSRKLGIKEGHRVAVLHSPKGYTAILAKLPAGVTLTTRLAGDPFDVVQSFHEGRAALRAELPKLRRAIRPAGSVWICWRKGGVTELSRDSIAELALRAGLEGVAICAVDGDWSALRLMLPKEKRKG